MLGRFVLFLAVIYVSPAAADHHRSWEFLSSLHGVWDATEGKDVHGTMTFVRGASGNTLYVQGEMGANKFDDFVTYDPKRKTWRIDGAGSDGSRYMHAVKAFPAGKMKAGQRWSAAATTGLTADGNPTTGSLQFVAKDSDCYQLTIKEVIDGQAIPDRILVAKRRQPKAETMLSQSWKEFLTGNWIRETTGQTDGKAENSRIEWKCIASGDALISLATSGDEGYGTLLYWDQEVGKLVEHGRSAKGHWRIEFDLKDETRSGGSISGPSRVHLGSARRWTYLYGGDFDRTDK